MSKRQARQNPPWVSKSLAASWVTLEDKVPPEWLPRLDGTKSIGSRLVADLTEYGCGAYGCVYPTLDPTVVLKVTTDDTEAQFAAQLAGHLPSQICTTYWLAMQLPDAKHKGRNVYLLWRESATDVGAIDSIVGLDAESAIHEQHLAAQNAYEALMNRLPPDVVHKELMAWHKKTSDMGEIDELKFISDGMIEAFDRQGVFFGDIHGGNLGRVERDKKKIWVITDPGHIAVIKSPEAAKKNPRQKCRLDHNALIADGSRWSKLEYVGVQKDDSDPDDVPLELRNCSCGSTLSKEIGRFPKVNPFGVGATWRVLDAASKVHRRYGMPETGIKVFVSDVYEQLVNDDMNEGMSLDEFKSELVRMHRDSNIVLARADLIAALPYDAVEESEISAGDLAVFHFVVID